MSRRLCRPLNSTAFVRSSMHQRCRPSMPPSVNHMRAIALNKTAVSLWASSATLRALYGRSVLKYRFTQQERTSTIILVIINRIPIIPVAKRFGPQKQRPPTACRQIRRDVPVRQSCFCQTSSSSSTLVTQQKPSTEGEAHAGSSHSHLHALLT